MINKKEIDEISLLFTKFCVTECINFNSIQNSDFKKALKKLRPAYHLPDPTTMEESLLTQLYNAEIEKLRTNSEEEAILVLEKNVDGISVFINFPFESQAYFDRIDVSRMKNIEDFKSAFEELSSSVASKFNRKIFGVVENFLDFTITSTTEAFKDIFIVKDQRELAERVRSEIECRESYDRVIRIFESVGFQNSDESLSMIDVFSKFIEKLHDLKKLAVDHDVRSSVIKDLYDQSLISDVKITIEKLQVMNEVIASIDRQDKIGIVTEKWLNLFLSTSLIHENDEKFQEIFNDVNLAAYAIFPGNDTLRLTRSLQSKIRFFFLKALGSASDYGAFDDFLGRRKEFSKPELVDLNVTLYWKTMRGLCPKLAGLALKLSSLPSSTSKRSQKCLPLNISSNYKIKFLQSL
jgi:hypothetical protein